MQTNSKKENEQKYPTYITFYAKKERIEDKKMWGCVVKDNIRVCKIALQEAKRAQWGRFSHEGNRYTYQLESILKEIDRYNYEDVKVENFQNACKTRASLCDLMWQAHNV